MIIDVLRERERKERVCVCESERNNSVHEREIVCVCMCVSERNKSMRERKRACVFVCPFVFVSVRLSVCVCQ